MTTMLQHLRDSGVDVTKAVGVIVEGYNDDGVWVQWEAHICMPLSGLPEGVEDTEEG